MLAQRVSESPFLRGIALRAWPDRAADVVLLGGPQDKSFTEANLLGDHPVRPFGMYMNIADYCCFEILPYGLQCRQ